MLHELFEKKAQEGAEKLALVFNNSSYSYAELNAQINQVARCLQSEHGVLHSQHVVVFLPKSPQHLILFMALSKLGAIYIPLSLTNCTLDQLEKIVETTRPTLVVLDQPSMPISAKTVNVETIIASLQNYDNTNLNIKVHESDAAYIMFTSGTTGAPKGVSIQHAGIAYWWHSMSEIFTHEHPVAIKNVLSFCLPSFDASIWEYMMAWTTTSALFMIDEKSRNDINKLVKVIEENTITHATLTPSTLKQILSFKLPASLAIVHTTGEACTQDIVEIFEQENKQLFNCYGPTEATFGLSVQLCSLALYDQKYGAPIGYPMGDKIKIHILNDKLEPADTGELYIDSPYLTRGYLNSPEETQQRFVVINGQKLYKTGDYFYNDKLKNVLRYLGRINLESVKIRGMMINVVEIENLLKKMKNIQGACVTAHEHVGQKFLVAHIYPTNNEETIKIEEIRKHLLKHLPSTALPAKFIIHNTPLPLTNNGKINREILINYTTHERNNEKNANDFLPIEKKVRQIFKEILHVNEIKKTDTFFSLGGDSIRLYELISKIENEFSVTLSTHNLYGVELSTSNLIHLIHICRWHKNPAPITLINDSYEEKKQPIFLIHPITGEASSTYLQFTQLFKEDGRNKELQFYGINARGLANLYDITDDMELMAQDYVNAIKKIQPVGPYLLFGWSFGGVMAWKIAELLESTGDRINSVVMLDTAAPYVLQNAASGHLKKMILKLIDELKNAISIHYNPEDIEKMPSSNESIIAIFDYLIQINLEHSQYLQLIAALLVASQSYFPNALSTIEPCLFSCKETRDEVYASLGRNSPSKCHDLCWYNSIPLQSGLVTRQVKPEYSHFDFLRNTELIQEVSLKWRHASLTHSPPHERDEHNSPPTVQELLMQLNKLLLSPAAAAPIFGGTSTLFSYPAPPTTPSTASEAMKKTSAK